MHSQMKIFFLLLFSSLIPLASFAAVKGDPHHVFALEGDVVLLRSANASHDDLVVDQLTPNTQIE